MVTDDVKGVKKEQIPSTCTEYEYLDEDRGDGNGNEFGETANRRGTRIIRSWRSDGKRRGTQRGETEEVNGRSPRV